jgi:hypothetical protein
MFYLSCLAYENQVGHYLLQDRFCGLGEVKEMRVSRAYGLADRPRGDGADADIQD